MAFQNIDYSKVGRKRIDLTKRDLERQVAVRVGSLKGLEKKEIVRRILIEVEKVQEEAFINGAQSISSINGRFVVKRINAKPCKHLITTDRDTVPPKNKIVFIPGKRINNLNEAFRIMSFTNEEENGE